MTLRDHHNTPLKSLSGRSVKLSLVACGTAVFEAPCAGTECEQWTVGGETVFEESVVWRDGVNGCVVTVYVWSGVVVNTTVDVFPNNILVENIPRLSKTGVTFSPLSSWVSRVAILMRAVVLRDQYNNDMESLDGTLYGIHFWSCGNMLFQNDQVLSTALSELGVVDFPEQYFHRDGTRECVVFFQGENDVLFSFPVEIHADNILLENFPAVLKMGVPYSPQSESCDCAISDRAVSYRDYRNVVMYSLNADDVTMRLHDCGDAVFESFCANGTTCLLTSVGGYVRFEDVPVARDATRECVVLFYIDDEVVTSKPVVLHPENIDVQGTLAIFKTEWPFSPQSIFYL